MYCYCGNDPVNFVDPSGHDWKSFWKNVWVLLVDIYLRALNMQMNNQIVQIKVTQTLIHGTQRVITTVADLNLQANSSQSRFETEKSQMPIQIAIGINNGIMDVVDVITKGAPGYSEDIHLLPKATFSSGVGPGGGGARHAGDLIFSRFFGEDYIMETSN